MGVQRKRRRREERLEEEEQGLEQEKEQERPREREAAPADRVLELQKTAGNRATNAAISRWGFPWFPAAAAAQWPKEPQVIADGLVIPLTSWSWSEGSSGVGGSSGRDGKAQLKDVHVVTPMGKTSADIALRVTSGRPFDKLVIVVPGKDGKGMTFTFTNVHVHGYQPAGEVDMWSFSYDNVQFSQSPPKAQPRP